MSNEPTEPDTDKDVNRTVDNRIGDKLAELDLDTEPDYDRLADEVAERIDTSTDLDVELKNLRRERERFSLVGSPSHTRTLAPGNHTDSGYHRHGSWGLVITAHEDVVWREATVNAESAGSTLLEVYAMDYEQAKTYDVGERLETHELTPSGGREKIHPDIVLKAGQTVFITRDTDVGRDGALPLKRGMEGVPWAEFNDNDVPMTVHCSWQLGRGGPGTQEFEDWRSAGWHRVLHNYRDMEFGFNELVE